MKIFPTIATFRPQLCAASELASTRSGIGYVGTSLAGEDAAVAAQCPDCTPHASTGSEDRCPHNFAAADIKLFDDPESRYPRQRHAKRQLTAAGRL